MERYKIEDGKIPTRALEVHILNHCNLNCDHCCSYSPLLKKWEIEPEQVQKDLLAIKKYLRPSFLKIVGGEPTLHSKLLEILKVAKASSISPIVSLTTNGNFLSKVTDECLEYLDWITVSIYPKRNYTNEDIKKFAKKAKSFGVTMNWKVQDKFVNMNRPELADHKTSKETFQGCWIHHRCHSVREGYFYCCTRTQYLKALSKNDSFNKDGIPIEKMENSSTLLDIKNYLNREEPLLSCRLCKGGQADLSQQVQLTPKAKFLEKQRVLNQCQEIN